MNDESRPGKELFDALQRCRSEMARVQQMALVGHWTSDLSGDAVTWSHQLFEMYGLDPECVTPAIKEFLSRYYPEDAERLKQDLRMAVDRHCEIRSDYRALPLSGLSQWHEHTICSVKDHDGRVVGFTGTVQDITRRKRIEEEHRENKLNLETFLDALRESALLLKRDGTVISANSIVAQRFGISRDELEGTNIYDVFSSHVGQTRRQKMDQVVRSGQAVHFEDQRSGRIFANSIYPIYDRSGEIDRFAILAVDVTEGQRTQSQLEGLNRLRESLLSPRPLSEKLHRITDGLVSIFRADFARIWVVRPGDRCEDGCTHAALTEGPHVCRHRNRCLHLLASSGRYTHLNGRVHQRVPFGCYKIGRVAGGEDSKFITNEVTRDPRVHDHGWAGTLGLVSFAGYRVISRAGKPAGVLALFGKRPISPGEDQLIESLAATASHVIETDQIEQEREELISELQKSISKIRQLSEMLPICASCKKVRDDQGYWSAIEQYLGEQSGTRFSHGICPDCARDLYPEFCDEE